MEEKQKRTNKELLAKGIKLLAISLLAIATGPIVTYNAFMNKNHPLFLVALTIGILIMLTAMFLIAKGISVILKSFFD